MSFEVTFKGDASLKNRFPFRLGATSYVIPADLKANVAFLADKVDDIELVLFESHEMNNLPDAVTVRALREMADRHDLTYTVHLPLDIWMGHADATVRQQSVDKCLRVIEGNDHRSLAFLPAGLLTALVKRLGGRPGKTRVLTMEIFDEEALSRSLDLLRRL